MNWRMPKSLAALALCATVWAQCAQASVVVTGTRVVFPGESREVTVRLMNDGNSPALVQAWIDTGNAKESPEQIVVPFALTPSMFRLDPGKGQSLRVLYAGEPLPADRESLFWLNVLEVPPKVEGNDDANRIQLAFRSRIKMMYRPAGLPGSAANAADQVSWTIVSKQDGRGVALKATNAGPYVVNLGAIELEAEGRKYVLQPGFIRPQDSATFDVQELGAVPARATVDYSIIDDWGAIRPPKRSDIGGKRND
ncbi:pilus assembly protein [Burkholderia sp. MSh2]|uniref:Pilus assembly protein n=2 Tax=Burkholderia TaxID=32008 RepID=A0A6J5DSZ6_9BURK|nr:fimbria/pilus periplasmic chaperone [Burkholderia paludis]KEZ07458.1 pilus assembly protein [Burkholderia sp. MSh2]CAB3756035.1 putative fimbrial chaperone YadV [Burkholderia paludis]VWB60020.1 pilus assembly protein [Burkholderia paludis]